MADSTLESLLKTSGKLISIDHNSPMYYLWLILQFGSMNTFTGEEGAAFFSFIKSAPLSATIIVGAFKLPLGIVGKIEESITLKLLIPWTRSWESTTDIESSPILHEQDGWYALSTDCRMKASI